MERRARIAWWLFLGLSGLFLLTSSGRLRTPDEYMPFFQAESLATRGTLTIPQAVRAGNLFGRYDGAGEPRAGYLPAQAFVAAPFYRLGLLLLHAPGVPDRARAVVLAFAACSSSAFLAAATVALFFWLSWSLSENAAAAAAAAAGLALATFLWPYAGYFFSEPLAACLLMAAAAIVVAVPSGEPVPVTRALVAGVLVGACLWVRLTHVLAIPAFLVATVIPNARRGWRGGAAFAGAASAALLALLAYNFSIWGDPLDVGYPATAEGGHPILVFTTPWYEGLYGFLLSPGKSLFLFAPPVVFALSKLVRLWPSHRRALALATVAPLTYLLFFVRYTQWEGGYCVGPRYLLPMLPLLCLALAPGLAHSSRTERYLFALLCILGAAVQVTSAATSFLEDQATPLRYYDAAWSYRLDYAPLLAQARRLWGYLASPVPAPLGLGFDRWWVFLTKAGVDTRTVAAMASLPVMLLTISAAGLRREWRRADP